MPMTMSSVVNFKNNMIIPFHLIDYTTIIAHNVLKVKGLSCM
jgi:hypothetical protein